MGKSALNCLDELISMTYEKKPHCRIEIKIHPSELDKVISSIEIRSRYYSIFWSLQINELSYIYYRGVKISKVEPLEVVNIQI